MEIGAAPPHKFRKLLLYAQEVEDIRYKKGGRTKKGFDQGGLITYLFKKAFRTQAPSSPEEILAIGSCIDIDDAMTGDVALYGSEKGEMIIALILGQIEKELLFLSPIKKKVVIESFSSEIEGKKFNSCLRIFNRETDGNNDAY